MLDGGFLKGVTNKGAIDYAPGLGDYCCPPMGLAKLYNNIPGNKRIKWVQGSTHGFVPPAPNQTLSRSSP